MKTQYGVYDNTSGQVFIQCGPNNARRVVEQEPGRYVLMKRSISEWLEVPDGE